MADITLLNTAAGSVTTPASGKSAIYTTTANAGGQPTVLHSSGLTYGLVGNLAVTSALSSAIGNTETQIIGVTIPASSVAIGTTFRISAQGLATNSTAGSTSTWRIRYHTASLGATILQSQAIVNTTTARTNVAAEIEALVTIYSIGGSGSAFGMLNVIGGSNGATLPTVGVTAAVTVDTTVSHVLELTFISGAASTTYQNISACIEINQV